jgi:hypothetical protein
MEENVFRPLKMRDTSVPSDWRQVLSHRANSYYLRSNREFVRGPTEGFEIPGPAHVFSTIEDMVKWMDNMRTGKVGGRELIARMQERTTLRNGEQSFYGAGLGMGEYRGVRTAGHSGQTGAFKTELVYCPDIEVGVVVLGNVGSLRADEVSRRVLDLYLGDRLAPLPAVAKGTAEGTPAPFLDLDPAAERLLGGYRLEADPSVLLALSLEEGWLVGAIVGEGLDFFRPIGPSEYENRHRNCRLAFSGAEGQEGAATRVRVTLRGKEMWATRVPLSRDARWIDECVGFYYSDELGVAYEVVRAAGGLAVRVSGSEARPLYPADTDILAGGIGILTFQRGGSGQVTGFDFGEPEDLGGRLIRFTRRDERR